MQVKESEVFIMNIQKIIATQSCIEFITDTPVKEEITVNVFSPALGEEKKVAQLIAQNNNGCLSIDRFIGELDLVCCRFELISNNEVLSGRHYVEEINNSLRNFDYPVADTKKGLQIWNLDDAIELGVKHAALNVNLGDFMLAEYEENNTIEFKLDGRTYFFDKNQTLKNDQRIKRLSDVGIIITYIVLNSKNWNKKVDDKLWNIIKHPSYATEGTISQFNIIEDEGINYYRAFIAFLSERYTREDEKYGRIVGMIIGNEVNSGYIWCNAGELTCDEYAKQYTTALRVAYQTSRTYYSNMRIYISLDHFWNGGMNLDLPLRYYGSKELLSNINSYCKNEGEVAWNIAHHPYPEDLNYPDFWNDKTATDDLETTRRITFKNLEVLAEFLYREEYLYNGERRKIILSEQGFNSHFTTESEVLQAMAYGKAYKKVMSIPEIDSFILHAHKDNYYEFGLNLGLWRRKKENNEEDAPKPIYYVFKAIDKKDEKGVYHWERY